jgi:hypothetical protein
MDITSVGLQTPFGNAGNPVNSAIPGIPQTNANNVARNVNAANGNPQPESTRVTLSDAGQARLAAEQSGALGVQILTRENVPANGQVDAETTPPLSPVTQTSAAAPVEAVASAAVGQGVTAAAASVPTTVAAPAGQNTTVNANANAATAAVGVENTFTPAAPPSTPETSNAARQATEEVTQQAQARQDDKAAARQDVSPVAQGASASRSALAA